MQGWYRPEKIDFKRVVKYLLDNGAREMVISDSNIGCEYKGSFIAIGTISDKMMLSSSNPIVFSELEKVLIIMPGATIEKRM